MLNEYIFALDIGTRSVTGIILQKNNESYTLVDYCMKEHKVRSMHDGQIHHVVEVAKIIKEVKETLEQKHGDIHKVSVAAAGRSLKTVESEATISLEKQTITEKETIKHLELSAVHAAQLKLASEKSSNDYSNYYCVGYSVLHYKVDGQQIGSLIDQSGDTATVEIIATFLPKIVVESLLSALNRADLEMEALTLEPIAAIHVLIPESMRRLNVALVDIGAGTSDIAITNHGTVVAYGMVPIAGDEITEAISDHYLLDYPIAEKIKRQIVNEGQAIVSDILGFETTIDYDTLAKDIQPSIEKLANAITQEIFNLNATAPKAVMLVGGGSLTPELTTALANKLQLPINRVAVRGIDAIQMLNKTDNLPSGPDFVTPIGIAIVAEQNPIHYITVHVNKQVIRMFEMKKLTVGDCLVQGGIEINKLYGKPGMASMITLNGKELTLPGELGGAPTILLNEAPATVDTIVKNGDHIVIEPGLDGHAANVTLAHLIEELPSTNIFYNNRSYELKTKVFVNGELRPSDYVVQDRDRIELKQPKTVHDFLEIIGEEKVTSSKEFTIYLNNKKMMLAEGENQILINNKRTSVDHQLKHNDQLVITSSRLVTVKDLLVNIEKEYWDTITVTFNGQPTQMKQPKLHIIKDGTELEEDSTIKPGDHIQVKNRKLEAFIFQDVFRYVDIDLANIGANFKLYKNNQEATFYDTVQTGDQLEIK
ncbi:cell division protein [Ornithinibacillus sp. L9]|uniref:Cell division protein n=1 Tax=Ornithinibacillus caprae TaxID=2678566 RepID=A0A6N8FBA0_9BACI|nr:cell division protein FtsA [Ornithinibacillus caprae]MUK86810.1 cell division protein [Ornithinibacillus caprae]